MGTPTQQNWSFKIGDGATTPGPEGFTQIAGLREVGDFTPFNRTTRDATTIADAQAGSTKKMRFNKLREGGELPLTMDYLPDDATQARLAAQEGSDDGVNFEYEYVGSDVTLKWAFNALVVNKSVNTASSLDEEGVDQVTFTLRINSDVVETSTP